MSEKRDKEQPAFSCGYCHALTPWWQLIRRGDAVISWACFSHLPEVTLDLQRLGERTEIVIREYRSIAQVRLDTPWVLQLVVAQQEEMEDLRKEIEALKAGTQ